jgi:hypothetical protein
MPGWGFEAKTEAEVEKEAEVGEKEAISGLIISKFAVCFFKKVRKYYQNVPVQ